MRHGILINNSALFKQLLLLSGAHSSDVISPTAAFDYTSDISNYSPMMLAILDETRIPKV